MKTSKQFQTDKNDNFNQFLNRDDHEKEDKQTEIDLKRKNKKLKLEDVYSKTDI